LSLRQLCVGFSALCERKKPTQKNRN
jgi:hypothetical protein